MSASVKEIFILFVVAGLLSFVTGGLTLLLFSLGIILRIGGKPLASALVNLPIILLKLLLLPFVLIAKTGESVSHTSKYLWNTGINNLKKKRARIKDKEDDDDDDDEKGVMGYIIGGFMDVFSLLTHYKLRYLLVLLFWVYSLGYPSIFGTVLGNPVAALELDNVFMLLLLGLPFLLTVLVSSLSSQFIGPNKKFWKVAADPMSDVREKAPSAPEAVAGAAAAGAGARDVAEKTGNAVSDFKDIKSGVGKATESADGFMASSLEGTFLESVADIEVAGLGPVGIALGVLVVVLGYIGIIAVIGSLIGALTWGWFNVMLPFFAKPLMGALGLGGAYGQWFGQSAGNTIGPQIDDTFEEEIRMVEQMGAKFGCMLEGPQCLRQWRMNNTVRPGSEEVGETYELRIDQFGLINDRVDVAYKEKGYTLPINFLISNTRHGLKGITARDVRYRISVEDLDHQGDEAYCSTEWQRVDTGTGDFMLPGLGVSPTKSLDAINLGDCGMLQPSMGINRVLNMEVKYNYSSQATLYFDAMSRQYRREQGMQPSFKKSQTARTPVQSYINIQSPVTYFETENSAQPRQPVPFSARFGFETPGFDVSYKVHPDSVKIFDSSLTEVTDRADCTGLDGSVYGNWDNNQYGISDRAEERINERQENGWFDRNLDPAPLRCTMQISEDAVNSISPTGEQLIMRIDANYTVLREDENQAFDVVNTRCTRLNCPLIVTKEYDQEHPDTFLYDTCDYGTSVDSYDGCTVITPEQGGDIDWTDPHIAKTGGGKEMILEKGETAYRGGTVAGWIDDISPDNTDTEFEYGYITHDNVNDLSGIIGLTEEEKTEIKNPSSYGAKDFLLYREERNDGRSLKIVYEQTPIRAQPCQSYIGDREEIRKHLEDRHLPEGQKLMAYGLKTINCNDWVKETISTLKCGADIVIEGGEAIYNAATGQEASGEISNACTRVHDKLKKTAESCDGTMVFSRTTETYNCWS